MAAVGVHTYIAAGRPSACLSGRFVGGLRSEPLCLCYVDVYACWFIFIFIEFFFFQHSSAVHLQVYDIIAPTRGILTACVVSTHQETAVYVIACGLTVHVRLVCLVIDLQVLLLLLRL